MLTISTPDSLRMSVEAASGGRVTVLYSASGQPGYYVVIPKFHLEDVDPTLGTGPHPAFIVNGVEKREIFVGQYLASVVAGEALSLPMVDPTHTVNFDQARAACAALGSGFHLMTNAEFAAVALWCDKNGFMPRGNTEYGRAHDAKHETGRRQDNATIGSTTGEARTLTGSGPMAWRHDNSPAGIADLCGNIWEWVGGLRLDQGEIQIIEANNAADNAVDHSPGSAAWQAIAQNGSLVAPGTAGSLKFDSPTPVTNTHHAQMQLNTAVSNRTDAAGPDGYMAIPYETLVAAGGVTAPALLKQLGLYPHKTPIGGDYIWVKTHGERLPIRGGNWTDAALAGVFALFLHGERANAHAGLGFRPAFVA